MKKCGLDPAAEQLYRAHFCAGCHALREFGGRAVSLLTNYDQTFLAMLYAALEARRFGPQPLVSAGCTALPVRRVALQSMSIAAREDVAALTVALVAAKLDDDREDEGVLRRAAVSVASRGLRAAVGQAHRLLAERGFSLELLTRLTTRQAAAEQDKSRTLASLSEPTAELMRESLAWLAQRTEQPEARPWLERLGASLGRFIYLWDALEDFDTDAARGRFNALRACHGDRYHADALRALLLRELGTMARALEQLGLGEQRPLCDQLIKSLRDKVHEKLPAPRNTLLPLALGWRRAPLRGDCDCGDCCSGCDCSGCDCGSCCSGCDAAACDCGSVCARCGCENAACCCDCNDCCNACNTPGNQSCCCWSSSSTTVQPPDMSVVVQSYHPMAAPIGATVEIKGASLTLGTPVVTINGHGQNIVEAMPAYLKIVIQPGTTSGPLVVNGVTAGIFTVTET